MNDDHFEKFHHQMQENHREFLVSDGITFQNDRLHTLKCQFVVLFGYI